MYLLLTGQVHWLYTIIVLVKLVPQVCFLRHSLYLRAIIYLRVYLYL